MSEQMPSIGRTVHYQKYGTPGGEHLAEPGPAVVIKVYEDLACDLFVMNSNGTYHNNKCPFSAEPKPGHWNWPPRV